MSSLDDNLLNILIDVHYGGDKCDAIAQIKKALTDANYVQIPMTEVVTRYERGKRPEVVTVNGTEIMTCQEFYDRFKHYFLEDETVSYHGDLLAVVRRAAGLGDKE